MSYSKQIYVISIILLITFSGYVCSNQGVYIAGVVTDDNGRKLPGVIVIIEHQYKEYMSIKTNKDGWFETNIPLPESLVGKNINITYLKSGYESQQKALIVVEGLNYVSNIQLIQLPEYVSIEPKEEEYTAQVYGYVENPLSGRPQPGAMLTYKIVNIDERETLLGFEKKKIDYFNITATKNNGYFIISYPGFYFEDSKNYEHSIVVEHMDFDRFTGTVKNPNNLIVIKSLKEKIDWLVRFNLIAAKGEVGGYPPFKFETNFRKLFEILGNIKYPDFDSFKWSLPVARHNTRETDVTTIHFSGSKTITRKDHRSNILMDVGIGIALVELNKSEEHEMVFPHLQLGISKFLRRLVDTSTTPHLRLGLSFYRLNSENKIFFELGLGF